MEKKIQTIAEYGIEVAAQMGQEFAVKQGTRHLLTCLNDLYRTNQIPLLEQLVQIQSRKLARTADIARSQHGISYELGMIMGVMNTMKEFLRCYHQQEDITQLIEECVQCKIPHIQQIIEILRQEPMLQHGKLAEKLGIDKSSLTPIVKKMENNGIITVFISGKFKYYILSNAGNQFADRVFPLLPKKHSVFYEEFGGNESQNIFISNTRIDFHTDKEKVYQIEEMRKGSWNMEDFTNSRNYAYLCEFL